MRIRTLAALAVVPTALLAFAVIVVPERDSAADFRPNVFSDALPSDAPVSPESAEVVARLAAQAAYTSQSLPVAGFFEDGFNSIVQEDEFSVPVYTVGPDQALSTVVWVDDDGQPQPVDAANGLQATFDAVPLPLDVEQLQADGSDGHLAVHQPSTDTLWEFWRFREIDREDGQRRFVAGYGARIDEWSRSTGALPHQWGARATSLDLLGGVMRMADFNRGVFPYALTMAVPVIEGRSVLPATRHDGPSSATPKEDYRHALTEGMRFRLPPGYDCGSPEPGQATRPRFLREMICVAARDYGLVISDRSGGTVNLYAEDDRTVGTGYQDLETSPWTQVRRQFSGPSGVLQDFPWSQLQLLEPASPAGKASS